MKLVIPGLTIVLLLAFAPPVLGQEITYYSGFWKVRYYQDDREIDRAEVRQLISTNDEAMANWKKHKTQEALAVTAVAAQSGLVLWGISELYGDGTSEERSSAAAGPILGSLGAAILGGVLLSASNKSKSKAIRTYNKQFDSPTSIKLVPTMNKNGLGLALRF